MSVEGFSDKTARFAATWFLFGRRSISPDSGSLTVCRIHRLRKPGALNSDEKVGSLLWPCIKIGLRFMIKAQPNKIMLAE